MLAKIDGEKGFRKKNKNKLAGTKNKNKKRANLQEKKMLVCRNRVILSFSFHFSFISNVKIFSTSLLSLHHTKLTVKI